MLLARLLSLLGRLLVGLSLWLSLSGYRCRGGLLLAAAGAGVASSGGCPAVLVGCCPAVLHRIGVGLLVWWLSVSSLGVCHLRGVSVWAVGFSYS